MSEPVVVFEPLHADVIVPGRSTELSAGYDVRAYLRGRRVPLIRGDGTEEEVGPAARAASAAESAALREGEPAGRAAAGADAGFLLVLRPGDRALVPTGFRARLPAGYEAQIRIRSSMAWRRGLVVPNAPGTVDADYPDEWFVLVQNASGRQQSIAHGERIAQVVLARHAVLRWSEGVVGRSTDRVGGLGSTGR